MKKMITLLASLAMVLSMSACAKAPEEIYTPGTYSAVSAGFGGDVKVTITVDASKISDVVIEGNNETDGIGKAALEDLKAAILKNQNAEIDAVGGATVTSDAVKEATAKAIAIAKGEVVQSSLQDGTYTATKNGFQEGYETVSVTIENGKIKTVEVVESTDFPVTVTEAPLAEIPAAIVEHQTYNVDVVTGATLTSNAIKMAVKDCLEQAGGSDEFSKAVVHADKVVKEDVTTDVLVIGAGGAGMMAAVEASIGENSKESSGLNVTLIEKAGFVGGITSLSGGVRYLYDDETGKYDEAWVNQCLEIEKASLSASMQWEFNEELMKNEIIVNPHANALLKDLGVVSEDAWGYVQFASNDGHEDPKWRGSYFTYVVGPYIEESDIDLRLNTAATHLVLDENGACIGATVEDKEGTYTIYAKKVILATGGFAQNLDLIKKYAPGFEEGIVFSSGTNDGDGIIMAEEINAAIIGNKMMGHVGADGNVGCRPDFGASVYYGWNMHPFVNMEGKRFTNEDKSKYQIYEDVLNQPELTAWAIVDGDDGFVAALEASTSEYVHKADTLEALADELGILFETLEETIKTWNASVDAGVDNEFGTSITRMTKIEEGPYYAYILRPITMTSEVGVKVDGNCRVMNTDGEVIDNLFAAGDMIMGGNIVTYYFDARGNGTAMYSGVLSGQTAKNEILK